MNSANNHSHDFGAQGASDTSTALAGAGIAQTGLPGQIAVVSDGRTKVAFVGFAPYPNTNDMLDFATAKTLIAKARTLAPVVVVYMHAGAEGASATHVTGNEETYVGEDRGNAKAFAHAAVDDGASAVIASGPHVLRGIEFYRHHLIDYSLGNFANYHDFVSSGTTSLSAILRVTIHADGTFVGARFTSVVLSSTGHATIDPADSAAHLVNALSAADFGPTAAVIQPDGTIAAPAET
jgi:poly-gamma-glutamate capsule biosynthesis protein CapA/YwtB (metallophosphatase superfamily)